MNLFLSMISAIYVASGHVCADYFKICIFRLHRPIHGHLMSVWMFLRIPNSPSLKLTSTHHLIPFCKQKFVPFCLPHHPHVYSS